MSRLTDFLKLHIWEIPKDNNEKFNYTKAIADNFDKIDAGLQNAVSKFTAPISYKGKVATFNDLPSGAKEGNIYTVTSENKNYIWNGTTWEEYSSNIDLTPIEEQLKTIQTTDIAEALTITDCAGVNGKLDIKSGKSEQETRSGKNILQLMDGIYENNGVTVVVKDGVITLNGTATETSFIGINLLKSIVLTTDNTYHLSAFNIETVGDGTNYASLRLNQESIQVLFNKINANGSLTTSLTLSYITIRTASGLTYDNFVVKPQLELGNGTDTWEQCGASPSPDYPSNIRNVGDNIQLYNMVDVEETTSLHGITYSFKDDILTLNGTSTGSHYIHNKNNNYNLKAGTYTISAEIISGSYTGTVGKQINASEGNMWADLGYIDATKTITTTTDVVNGYNSFYIGGNAVFNNLKIRFKLNKSSIALPYTPYGCGSADFKVENEDKTQSKMVSFPFTKGQVLHKGDYLAEDGIHQVRNTVVFDGSDDENWKLDINLTNCTRFTIELKANHSISQTCSHLKYINNYSLHMYVYNNILYVFIPNNVASTVDEFKTFLAEQYEAGKPFTVEYPLAEEIITTYTTEQEEAYYQLQHLLMYEGYTNITCIDEIKSDIQATYSYNNEINTTYGKKIDTLEARLRQLEKALTSLTSEVSE